VNSPLITRFLQREIQSGSFSVGKTEVVGCRTVMGVTGTPKIQFRVKSPAGKDGVEALKNYVSSVYGVRRRDILVSEVIS